MPFLFVFGREKERGVRQGLYTKIIVSKIQICYFSQLQNLLYAIKMEILHGKKVSFRFPKIEHFPGKENNQSILSRNLRPGITKSGPSGWNRL